MKDSELKMNYLEIQEYAGITKHMGGFAATKELLSLCHLEDAHEVLEVGCGIGVGSINIAKTYGCHVVAVDISKKMIGWARQRVDEEEDEGVKGLIEFSAADVLDLPFEPDRFDVAICESVLTFVRDKPQAIRECIRVIKPGGYVGLNETIWVEEPPAEKANQVQEWGTNMLDAGAWLAIWERSGLQDREIRTCRVDARTEMESSTGWIGRSWIRRANRRLLRLYLENPSFRQFTKEHPDTAGEMFKYLGYGLFVGKK